MVLDAISVAARNVSILMNRDLTVPPIPLKTIKKQDETNTGIIETPEFQAVRPVNDVTVYEVWKVILKDSEQFNVDINEVYVVISGEYHVNSYGRGDWNNINYRGFYTTENEALNEISGYL